MVRLSTLLPLIWYEYFEGLHLGEWLQKQSRRVDLVVNVAALFQPLQLKLEIRVRRYLEFGIELILQLPPSVRVETNDLSVLRLIRVEHANLEVLEPALTLQGVDVLELNHLELRLGFAILNLVMSQALWQRRVHCMILQDRPNVVLQLIHGCDHFLFPRIVKLRIGLLAQPILFLV